MTTRFAPSPSGYLHLGHAFAAWQVWASARSCEGQVLLRIEDIDRTRCRLEFEEAIYEDLEWLGLEWSPPVLRQSDRLAAYEARLQFLIDQGLVYRCFRSRREVEDLLNAPHGPHHATEKGMRLSSAEEGAALAAGKNFAWRLSLQGVRDHLGPVLHDLTYQEEIDGRLQMIPIQIDHFDHIILGRRDIGTSYHIAAVHDDIDQGITHIIRGEDLRDAASLHALLFTLFDAPVPRFRHHRLITDEHGRRLAKRDEDMTLQSLRAQGHAPAELRQRVGLPD